jgi:hypothetical protein
MEEIGLEAAPFPAVERSRDDGASPSPSALTPA